MKRPYLQPELDLKKFLALETVAELSFGGALGENNSSDWNEDDEDGDTIE